MRLLLDTHIAVWSVTGDDKLSAAAHREIATSSTPPVVSVVTLWEIAIKHALKNRQRDPMTMSAHEARDQFQAAGFDILPVTAAHAAALDDLPALHGDPLDRMLVAQALTEPMRLLTHDARLTAYSELVMLA